MRQDHCGATEVDVTLARRGHTGSAPMTATSPAETPFFTNCEEITPDVQHVMLQRMCRVGAAARSSGSGRQAAFAIPL